ncbi:MAG TPA: hypothetical protein DD706_04155 [Nitrospiraceae bacterium]|nr:hypothetical protein [Nitrospiraceae bacterium]
MQVQERLWFLAQKWNESWPDPRAWSMGGQGSGCRQDSWRNLARHRLFKNVHVDLSKGIVVNHVPVESGSLKQDDKN